MSDQFETISITPTVEKFTKKAIRTAIDYEHVTHRKLGITGEIGELLVCKELGLKLLLSSIAPGIDAVDNEGNTYQIKARRGATNRPGARVGTFSKHKFNFALLAILDYEYNIIELYKTTFKALEPILQQHVKRNPRIRQFIGVATPLKIKGKN